MERNISLKTKDGHLIYGTLRYPRGKITTMVIFVHGLTGHKNEHLFYNGARFFEQKRIATFRFDLYSGEKKGRKLAKSTIHIHAQDLDVVVSHFRKKYKKIFVVGHSLGGPVILLSKTAYFDSVVFWDATYDLAWLAKECRYNKCLDTYILQWGTEYLIGKKMVKERLAFLNSDLLVKKITKPIKIICAGKGVLIQGGKRYYQHANSPKEFHIIKGAGHTFDEDGIEEILFDETLKWVKKQSARWPSKI